MSRHVEAGIRLRRSAIALLIGGLVGTGLVVATPITAAPPEPGAAAASRQSVGHREATTAGDDRAVRNKRSKARKQANRKKRTKHTCARKRTKAQRARCRANQQRPKPTRPKPKRPPGQSPTTEPPRLPAPGSSATPAVPGPSVAPVGSLLVPGTSCPAFPADNVWNARIDHLPVHPRSQQWAAAIGDDDLHPDFGPSYGEQSVPYGIPVTVVAGSHPRVPVRFDYDDESDRVDYPLGLATRIEGGPESTGDRHTIVVDADSCTLFETYDTHPGTPWTAGSGAVWSLRSNALRPAGWTSADAAGLPILPGLLTVSDVASGVLRHAIRFTAPRTQRGYLWPARHFASDDPNPALPPMGARFRLRAGFDLTEFSPQAQVVLIGLQRYGLMLADNGTGWYFQGTADEAWPEDLIDELKQIPSAALEAVDTTSLQVSSDSGQAH